MAKTNRTYRLADDVIELLEKASRDETSATVLIEQAIRDRNHEWNEALMHLRRKGWSASEILAACMVFPPGPRMLRSSAFVADEIEHSLVVRHGGIVGADSKAILNRVRELREDPSNTDGTAVLMLARAYQSGDAACMKAIRSRK